MRLKEMNWYAPIQSKATSLRVGECCNCNSDERPCGTVSQSDPEVNWPNRQSFFATDGVSAKTDPGGRRSIHILRVPIAHLKWRVNTKRIKVQGRAYCAFSPTIDEIGQLWLGEVKRDWTRNWWCRPGPDTLPCGCCNGILDQHHVEMFVGLSERERISAGDVEWCQISTTSLNGGVAIRGVDISTPSAALMCSFFRLLFVL